MGGGGKIINDLRIIFKERCVYSKIHFLEMRFKGEVQARINIISKERVKISPRIGAKMMKIG